MRQAAPFLLAGILGASALSHNAPGQSPRYAFEPGDHLIYEASSLARQQSDGSTIAAGTGKVEIWCLARQEDRARLFISLIWEAPAEFAGAVVLEIDAHGRMRVAEPMEARLKDVFAALIALPPFPTPVDGAARWVSPPDVFGRCFRVTRSGADSRVAESLRYDYTLHDCISNARLAQERGGGAFWVDTEGLVRRAELHAPAAETGVQVSHLLELRAARPLNPGRVARADDDAQKLIAAFANEDRLLDNLLRAPQELERTLDLLDRLWSAFAADLPQEMDSPFRQTAQAQRTRIVQDHAAIRRRAAFAQRWLNKAAPHWSLQDSSGTTVLSENARAPLTVEAFWISGPDAARTLAALRELRPLIEQRGGRLICMSLDDDPATALRTIETYGADLTHVLAGGMRLMMDVPGTPILRVLDERNVIRRIAIGWRASYADLLR